MSATVAYQGRDKTSSVSVDLSAGVRFLPIKHTVLAPRGVTPGQRHFIELFAWVPTDRSPGGWQLTWSLSEVVRDDVVSIHREVIATIPDSLKQSDLDVDVRRLAALRVNAAGEAEWAIPHRTTRAQRSDSETDRERQEVLAQRRTREAADERVDWNQEGTRTALRHSCMPTRMAVPTCSFTVGLPTAWKPSPFEPTEGSSGSLPRRARLIPRGPAEHKDRGVGGRLRTSAASLAGTALTS